MCLNHSLAMTAPFDRPRPLTRPAPPASPLPGTSSVDGAPAGTDLARNGASAGPQSDASWADGVVIGHSTSVRAAVDLVSRVGASRATTVLVCGETGTGKELFARGVHAASPNRNEPFVAVNCAAIPEALLESELFGHEKGAFTDAGSLKRGLFELAGRGAIFLDEVGELPLKLQPKLLRVLEQRTFRRVGGSAEMKVGARVIAGTNVSLADAVDSGTFREDLFYRLTVVRIDLPPLRDRDGDVDVLARYFLDHMAGDNGHPTPDIAPAALAKLRVYAWPGNVRELKNAIERAVIVAGGNRIEPEHILLQRRRDTATMERQDTGAVIRIPDGGKTLEAIENEAVRLTLAMANGNMSAAARILGVSRPTLARKLRQAGLMRRSVVVQR